MIDDLEGRLRAACLPQDASTAACTTTSSTKTLGFTPLANDRLGQVAHENGLVTNVSYFPYGPVQQITVGSSQQLVYGYDELLNVTSIAETQSGTGVSPGFSFNYDAVYRLTQASYPANLGLPSGSPGDAFDYDTAGNREKPGDATAYEYDGNNRLTKSPGYAARCYDADGNQTSTRSSGDCATGTVAASFTWDAQNRLSAFSQGATSASYVYDPFGRRIKKAVGSATTYFLWDGDRLLAEYDGSGTRQVRYAYAQGFAPVQVAYKNGSSENIYDVHSDHLDTPRMLTDHTGLPSWRANYEAFGKAHVSNDPDGSVPTPDPGIVFNLRFPGQYYDAESGLHYNRFRTYDPGVGRYVSADPIGQRGGVNLFGYALGNPIVFFDPLGWLSYFVSRSVDGTGGRDSHGFIVTGADYVGDPNADIHSFGQNADWNMGNVSPGFAAGLLSKTTAESDRAFWLSQADPNRNECSSNPGQTNDARLLPGTDEAYSDLAARLADDTFYNPFGVNSNAAAQAIANEGSQATIPFPGDRSAPGADRWQEVTFH